MNKTRTVYRRPPAVWGGTGLEEIIRQGAPQVIQQANEAELCELLLDLKARSAARSAAGPRRGGDGSVGGALVQRPQVHAVAVAAGARTSALKTYRLHTDQGMCFAFEIENAYIRPRTIATLLTGVSGITDIRVRKPFSSFKEDIHVRFRYRERAFVVWEPFGDSSRYWIGPYDEQETPLDVTELRAAFDRYTPPLLMKILGDLISLNFRSLFHCDGRGRG